MLDLPEHSEHTETTGPPSPVEELRALMERARIGDTSVLPRLRATLDTNPALWERLGNLAARAEQAWVEMAAGRGLHVKESLARKLAALKAELAGPDPTPVERLLAERVAACWLQMAFADAAVAQARDVPLRQGEYLCRRQDAAHRRYLTALAALSTLRRLLPGAAGAGRTGSVPEPVEAVGFADAGGGSGDERAGPPAVALFPPPRPAGGAGGGSNGPRIGRESTRPGGALRRG